MSAAILRIREYLDQRADAEYTTESAAPHGNEEMSLLNELNEIENERAMLIAALHKIGGGFTDADSPSLDLTPAQFQSGMWTWSQRVAKSALAKVQS